MDRKFQVFISSTYIDLLDERQEAVKAILDAGHIPAGMELFKAGNESQLDVIRRWINESDIFMLILGGRYGSIEPNSKKSYTHLEYEYAIKIHKPIFAVVLSDTMLYYKAANDSKTKFFETENVALYKEFKDFALTKITRIVNGIKEINIAVQSSLHDISKNPKIYGWVRELSISSPHKIYHKCYNCGKEELLPREPNFKSSSAHIDLISINSWHKINIETPGYGSKLDSINVNFELCDKCLVSMIDNLKLKHLIYGDDTWGPIPEDYESSIAT